MWRQPLAFIALSLLWGSSWIAAGTAAGHIPPYYAAAVRFSIGMAVLLPVILLKRIPWPRRRTWLVLLILSITMIVLPLSLLVWAERQLSPSTTALLFAAAPLLAAALAPAFTSGADGKQVPGHARTAMLVAFAGIAFATGAGVSLNHAGALAAGFLAVLLTAGSALYAKRELTNVSPVVSTAALFAIASLVFAGASLLMERGQPAGWDRYTAASLISLGVLAGACGFSLYLWLLRERDPYQVLTVQWCEPLLALLESAVLWHQPVSLLRWVGIFITLGSVAIVQLAGSSEAAPIRLEVTG